MACQASSADPRSQVAVRRLLQQNQHLTRHPRRQNRSRAPVACQVSSADPGLSRDAGNRQVYRSVSRLRCSKSRERLWGKVRRRARRSLKIYGPADDPSGELVIAVRRCAASHETLYSKSEVQPQWQVRGAPSLARAARAVRRRGRAAARLVRAARPAARGPRPSARAPRGPRAGPRAGRAKLASLPNRDDDDGAVYRPVVVVRPAAQSAGSALRGPLYRAS